jgi:hypothetical protein
MIGRLTTSFLQGKVTPTTTSTIFNPYVDPATVESKTGYSSESPGETLDFNKRGTKTKGVGIRRYLNDLLPYKLRPIKARRRRGKAIPNLRHEVYAFRLNWVVLYRPKLKRMLNIKP